MSYPNLISLDEKKKNKRKYRVVIYYLDENNVSRKKLIKFGSIL